jgi:large subunit ribosomal protein L22
MQYQVKLKNLRISPRKVRLVADVIRGKNVQAALDTLAFLMKRASNPMSKMVKSGIANAKNQGLANADKVLYVKEIYVNEGPTMKRFMPRAQGRATTIRKHFSHITLTLAEKEAKVSDVNTKSTKK